MHTVYYIMHQHTGRRVKWYRSLTGARIACRLRNLRLGFQTRVDRVYDNDMESELCITVDGVTMIATYCIVEDTIESSIDSIIEHSPAGAQEDHSG